MPLHQRSPFLKDRSEGSAASEKLCNKNDTVCGLVLAFTTAEGSLQSFTLPETNSSYHLVPENG